MASRHQYRLAVTAFADPSRLWRTVSAVLDAGVPVDDLCICGLACLMARFAPTASMTDGHLERLILVHRQAREWSGSFGNGGIAATSEPVLELALQAQAADGRTFSPAQAPLKASSDLENNVRRNLITLIVRSSDAQQKVLATRSLLAHAQNPVVTYEQVASEHQH